MESWREAGFFIKKERLTRGVKRSIGDFVGIQTQNLLIRSQMLYSVELRSLFAFASAKIRTSFETSKASGKKSYSDHTQIIF